MQALGALALPHPDLTCFAAHGMTAVCVCVCAMCGVRASSSCEMLLLSLFYFVVLLFVFVASIPGVATLLARLNAHRRLAMLALVRPYLSPDLSML